MIRSTMGHLVHRLPDGPSLMRALAELLLAETPPANAIVDLSDTLVLVPASRARRSLERHLHGLAAERGLAVVPPHVVTPGALAARLVVPRGRLLGSVGVLASWRAAIACSDRAALAPLVPHLRPDEPLDEASAESLARRAAALHRECASACRDFADVATHVRTTMPESSPVRWQALAELSAVRDRLLSESGAADADAEARDAAVAGRVHAGRLRRAFVLFADPDPLHRALLAALGSNGVAVAVAVHASGAELPAPLDEHGFPRHAEWSRAAIDVPEGRIALAGTPSDQAAAAIEAVADVPAPRRTSDILIAVPDPAVAAEIASRLPAWGVPVAALPGRSAADAPLGTLVAALAEWVGTRSCESLGALARHPDVARMLAARGVRDAVEQATQFAASTGARSVPGAHDTAASAAVAPTVDAIDGWCGTLAKARGSADAARALRIVLDAVVRPAGPVALEASQAALQAIEELESLPAALGGSLDAAACLRLVHVSMAGVTLPSGGEDGGIELMGWLDAGIDDAPHVIVTGMNEGLVPEGLVIDPWLPDSARERLGMLCARRRQARDAWILHALLARKRSVRLVCGATDADGEPLHPSRFLLGLQGEPLARRVLWLAGEHSPRAQAARWSALAPVRGLFGPSPVPEGETRIDSMSVTSFRDWFSDPALLRLKRDPRLRLEEGSCAADELDAMAFGSLVHEVLEEWGRGAAERTAAGQAPETDPARIEEEVLAAFARIRRARFATDLRAAYRVQFALCEERLRAFARVQAAHAAAGWSVVHVELVFGNGPSARPAPLIGPQRVRLTGRIDRIDVHPRLGHAAIDYKTSADATPPGPAHRKPRGGWVDLQLPLYRVLLAGTGIEVEPSRLAYFALPSNPAAAAVLFASEWDAAFAGEAEAEARRIAALIEAGIFEDDAYGPRRPWPDDPFAPVFCDGMRGLRAEAMP